MKSTGFARLPRREPAQCTYTPRPRAAAVAISDGKARMVVQVPKAPPIKPGKSKPSAKERAWIDWIAAYGCVACRMDGHGFVPPAVHHILQGGMRMGHLFTLPLCDPGHHQNGQPLGLVSRHPWKARFEAKYGPEESLLRQLQAERLAQ